MRYSKQREEVLRVLKSTDVHPDAEWVYSEVKKSIKNISMGTVYRNLRELSDSGEILVFAAGGSIMHFDGDNSDHSHFVCNSCGRIIDIHKSSGLKPELSQAGYTIDHERLIFFGICPDCVPIPKTVPVASDNKGNSKENHKIL